MYTAKDRREGAGKISVFSSRREHSAILCTVPDQIGCRMPLYYFDFRDANGFTRDDQGYDLPDLEAVQWEAVLSLVDQSRSASTKPSERLSDLEIYVRDAAGPVMSVTFKLHPRRSH